MNVGLQSAERESFEWGDDTGSVQRILRFIFADRAGITLFFATIVFAGLYWRIDFFILDTFPIANAVADLSHGRLAMESFPYGTRAGPGMVEVDGRLYARNYGQVVTAVPIVWLLDAVAAIGSTRMFISGAWSLSILGVAYHVGKSRGSGTTVLVGGAVALVAFFANALFATEIPTVAHAVIALQIATILATGLLVVLTYRVLATLYDRRTGVAAGSTVLLVGPVGFWASIPKRHIFIAAATVGVVYALVRAHTDGPELRYRVLAYAIVGLSTWFSAPDAFAMMAALVPVDLVTGRRDRRALATIGLGFGLSLIPFLVTNTLLSGNPMMPPRMLPNYEGAELAANASEGGSTDASGGGESSVTALATVLDTIGTAVGVFVGLLSRGVAALEPTRLYHVFIRSGRIPGLRYSMTGGEPVDLTILETAPVLAGLVAAPFAGKLGIDRFKRPIAAADMFAILSVFTFGFMYMHRLPLHSTITVRYLMPIVPLGVYGLYRMGIVRRTLRFPRLLTTAGATVIIAGGAFAVLVFAGTGDATGIPMQGHAVANLVVAGAIAVWALVSTRRELDGRVGAVVLGVAIGASALFVLLSGLEYFSGGRAFALPIARVIESILPVR